ncbi:TPM domain-containing protein [Hymenobacter sediminicola]|uniref:TPM domain-containing protein n=1 Tax=Hymenobacter sediminicola TaxID=2761579 RepID=A0A7G7W7S8_9BACT|nr:TPM domain-containing protein [Hymenobacter sediminicola]QNH62421.1 TPM domain-containing protein [Hymenobacter sediminicola]
MPRFAFLLLLLLLLGGSRFAPLSAQSADGLPARPSPFRFVNDGGQLLSAADAQKLENGLRRYADNTGTQLVIVTVPTLGGRDIADYGRALGTAWGVGQRDKNNGIVLLLAAQEHQVTIQAGSGLRSQITPALTARVISEQMTPSFKQGRYFTGLRNGLNTLMQAANPDSAPMQPQAEAATDAAAAGTLPNSEPTVADQRSAVDEPASEPFNPNSSSSGIGYMAPSTVLGLSGGVLLVGAVVVIGGIWLLVRMFRRRSAATVASPQGSSAPTFYPPQNNQPPVQPNGPAGNYGPGYGNRQSPDFLPNRTGGGSGMGGVLLTGAAAAAGAYLGNRMANGQNQPDSPPLHPDTPSPNLDSGAATGGAAGAGGFPFLNDSGAAPEPAPDYFSDAPDASPDYFSSDNDGSSSYDDASSGDTGGGGFDDDNSNSGSW